MITDTEKNLEKTEFAYGKLDAGFKAKLSFIKRIAITGSAIFKTGSESKTSIHRKGAEDRAFSSFVELNK